LDAISFYQEKPVQHCFNHKTGKKNNTLFEAKMILFE